MKTTQRILALCGAAGMAVLAGVAAAQQTQPADAQPTVFTTPAAETVLDAVHRGLTLSDRDRQILINVRDNTKTVDEAGFYLMLSKAADLPKLDKPERLELDSPAVPNLIKRPDDYRYKPMRLTVRIHAVTRLTTDTRKPDQLISPSPYWPRDENGQERPIWQLLAVNVDPQSKTGLPSQPIIIYSPVLPPDLPGNKPGEDGYREYGEGKAPLYNVQAVFYKTTEDTSREGKPMRYPNVLAWQWEHIAEVGSFDTPLAQYIIAGIILMGIVLGGALFFFMRKRTKQYKQDGGMWQKYRSLRDEDEAADALEETPADIDPDLAAAAREYRKDRGLEDEAAEHTDHDDETDKDAS